jgi:hypothetical protein
MRLETCALLLGLLGAAVACSANYQNAPTDAGADATAITADGGGSSGGNGSASGSSGGSGDGAASGSGGGSGSSGASSGAASGDGGACANPCPIQCCSSGAVCSTDRAGNKSCVETCTNITACPSGLVCAPLTDPAGNPVGPYACKSNDGQSYDGCGTAICNGCATQGFSCAKAGNNTVIYYCGRNCRVASDCGDAGGVCCLPTVACGFCGGTGCAPGVCGPC